MKYTAPRKLDKHTLVCFFEDVWNAEAASDVEVLYSLLQNVWENIDEDPDFEEYEDLEKAQLFRCCGFFLSHYGKAKNVACYQERSKNLLTAAISLFYSLNQTEKALESQIILGLCYFYEGAIAESEAIFEFLSNQFEGDQLNPLYLRSQLNYTMVFQWKGEFQKAFETISEFEVPMEFCRDTRILTIYHTQAGLIYRGIEQYDRAVYHYNKCIEIAQEKNNWLVVGKNHNNLAFLYKVLGKFELAHFHIEQAISIFRTMNHAGWLANIIDTKAAIYLEELDFEAALATISEAVAVFQTSDDFAGLADALWNKTKSLLGLERKTEAFETFAALCQIAQINIGQFAVARYAKLLAEIIEVKPKVSAENKVKKFGKAEIRVISETKAAKADARISRHINRLNLLETKISLPQTGDSILPTNVQTFYLAAEKASEFFGIGDDVILAIAAGKAFVGDIVLAVRQERREYLLGRMSYDESFDIRYLLSGEEPFPLDEIEILGKAIGFCAFTAADAEILEFAALPALQR